jgi:hypothetical protein
MRFYRYGDPHIVKPRHVTPTTPIQERFEKKIKRMPSGCWLWIGHRDKAGYGKIGITKRRCKLAHRVAFELYNGPIPDDMDICHHCDNPPCCNPEHLFLGNALINARDKMAKGRRRLSAQCRAEDARRADPNPSPIPPTT